ncbi:hypothetical protein CLV59_103480 [Chitinophaga dinghuensis]|uniref:Uncharacterized protein n=2 Tax=Chitinophaga dinghuensis TaxID=1539050 RepID=A0A327W3Z1_9BACT|nr:hypothetical protein CLV59_103480 [Chitinophaga dinghuensis]
MSADNKMDSNTKTITLRGRLILRMFAPHSKSEHMGVYIASDQGEYLIRPAEGNPFADNPLMPMAGKIIAATGTIVDYVFLVTSWKEVANND